MIAEAGLAALWLAAALSLLQTLLGLGPAALRSEPGAIRAVAVTQGALTSLAMILLIVLFARTDLSVELVAENSHTAKLMLYKLAGSWGNHEGSMLLWVTVLGVSGAILALFSHRLEERTFTAALGAQGALALGFFGFLLFASNPFARLSPAAVEGRGLNPLLQDPGLAFHPPTLYFGYVGLSVAFSLAVGALLTGRVDRDLAKAMRPWVLGAWIFLTLGITAGSYWAYYELGWGGWWFWDPVENASLMPWLAATALLHSINVLASRDSLRAWTIMLAVVAFSMSMVGTFLVRSGVLTSVHAFAVDPGRGAFLLVLLAVYVGAALALFAVKSSALSEGPRFQLLSREAGLVGNNLLLTVILGVVFIGTLYPLFVEAISGEKLSVGPPYFNAVAGPIALLLALLAGVGPLLSWRSDSGERLRRLAIPGLVGLTVFAAVVFVFDGGLLAKLSLGVAAALLTASILPLFGRRLRRTPLPVWGMVVAHAGVAVAIAGMAGSALLTREVLVAAKVGDTVPVGPWLVRFESVTPTAGPNWTALEAELRVSRGGGVSVLKPQARFYSSPPTGTTESAIKTVPSGQLYTVLGQATEDGRWQLRLWWKPLVTLIWLGGILIALGGGLSLIGRALRGRRKENAR
ncbi:heme lyase CcmF/NrfE family subunit [Sphingomonas sinipercae]|uniref:Heme lyase CcmF/NrfE family subunit n=1 Tax=Sphingomonas sinipercae TaxID=2714944 RepID=A0A6G7ZNP0_9SPHN|nr:heme lyase CcmF/NrfE family subunit [Sphingomonas sinipercae]QIL02553.1 heme lyase CcmF/NrfE family subunit [Sphingomonas sinipercae]